MKVTMAFTHRITTDERRGTFNHKCNSECKEREYITMTHSCGHTCTYQSGTSFITEQEMCTECSKRYEEDMEESFEEYMDDRLRYS